MHKNTDCNTVIVTRLQVTILLPVRTVFFQIFRPYVFTFTGYERNLGWRSQSR